MVIAQFDVYLVKLDPAVGSEIQKTRPCAVVSPADVNRFVRTVLVAPLTSAEKLYPSRVPCEFAGRKGQVAIDQIRCADHSRLVKHLGRLDAPTREAVSNTLVEMFSPRPHP